MDKSVLDVRLQKWIPIFEAWAQSGLSKKDFCKENGIERSSFYRWQKILRDRLLEKASFQTDSQTASANSEESSNYPQFFEITTTSPNVLTNTGRPDTADCFARPSELPDDSGKISISFEGFSVQLSGYVDEPTLTSILRAVKHA